MRAPWPLIPLLVPPSSLSSLPPNTLLVLLLVVLVVLVLLSLDGAVLAVPARSSAQELVSDQ